jgi:alanine racemase
MRIRPTEAIVDLDAIAHNITILKNHVGAGVRFMAVVKANAYGHGILQVAKTAVTAGADLLGVALTEEAVALRQAGITLPVFVLGIVPPEGAEQVVRNDLTVAVSTLESARAFNAAAKEAGCKIPVHIKVDTGMGRIGIKPPDVPEFVNQLKSLGHIRIEGIFSHFSSADEKDKSYAHRQLKRFNQVIATLHDREIHIPIKHMANSAGTIDLPESHFDMVRPGISIYGIHPSPDTDHSVDLRPAMSLKTRIAFLKELAAGSPVSYNNTYITKAPTRIATLPIGYADGYPRLLSNRGQALVHGQRVPVVGRVCMDMTMLDVSTVSGAEVGSEVVLFGRQDDAEILADEIAHKTNTIAYEIVCGISPRVPKIYNPSY